MVSGKEYVFWSNQTKQGVGPAMGQGRYMVKLSKKRGSPPAGLQVKLAYSSSPAGLGDPPMEFIKGEEARSGALRVSTSGEQGLGETGGCHLSGHQNS